LTADARQFADPGARASEAARHRDCADSTATLLFDREIVLRDGTRVHLRPIRPDDAPRLIALHDRLSLDTRYHRFFSAMRRLPPDWAKYLANVDYLRRFALVAESPVPGDDAIIAVARFEPTDDPDTAEVAFVVQDDWQNRGLGSVLFTEILRAGRASGSRRFRAWVLTDNRRMIDLIHRYGTIVHRSIANGVLELVFVPRDAT
jgi:RimJ/RimL family protein N-acetyltransferase